MDVVEVDVVDANVVDLDAERGVQDLLVGVTWTSC
jgi:hypothetical protein